MGAAACIIAAACADKPPAYTWTPPPLDTGVTAGPSTGDLKQSAPTGEGLITPWLEVKDKRIRLPNGQPFHGRGANVHDTRSCDSCSFEPPHVDEVLRRIDKLTEDWHANFLRLLLESYPDDGKAKIGSARVHYRTSSTTTITFAT